MALVVTFIVGISFGVRALLKKNKKPVIPRVHVRLSGPCDEDIDLFDVRNYGKNKEAGSKQVGGGASGSNERVLKWESDLIGENTVSTFV